jgi:hypothetical protein
VDLAIDRRQLLDQLIQQPERIGDGVNAPAQFRYRRKPFEQTPRVARKTFANVLRSSPNVAENVGRLATPEGDISKDVWIPAAGAEWPATPPA